MACFHHLLTLHLFFADIQAFGQGKVAGVIRLPEVCQQPAARSHQLKQAAAGAVIQLVGPQVLGELCNPF